MKCLLKILLFLTTLSALANECDLTIPFKNKLINNSSYSVDDITCERGVYKWHISNKRYMSFSRKVIKRALSSEENIKRLIAESSYYVEKLTVDKLGIKHWHISNAPFLKSNESKTKVTRDLASVGGNDKDKYRDRGIVHKTKKHALAVSLYSGVASIASTDKVSNTTEKSVTDIGVGVNLTWTHFWTQKLSLSSTASFKSFKFKVGEDQEISNGKITQSYIGMGLNYVLNDSFVFTLGAGIGESLVLTSDGDNLAVEKLSLSVGSLGLRSKLVEFKSGYSLYLKTRLGSFLPAEQKGYEVRGGSYYYVGLGSSYSIDDTDLFMESGYTERSFEVNDATQTSKDLGLVAGVGWSF